MTSMQKQSLGFRKPEKIAEYLRQIGDEDAALRFDGPQAAGQSMTSFFGGDDAWAHTGILLGFISPSPPNAKLIDIENAHQIPADDTLKNTRIKIALERFWVQSYPGWGKHTILCEFMGKNQIQGEAEEMRFALTTEANDRSAASISGSPIFLGVSVGQNGIAFEGRTVNVKSDRDETLLAALGSGPFRDGLALLTTAQPALKPFVGLAGSLVSSVLNRSKNKQIYYFRLGLDFANSNTSACLRHGSYVVVQGGETGWNWGDYAYNPDSQEIVRKSDQTPIDYNYLMFRVSEFQ
jgi:hypothetical protein